MRKLIKDFDKGNPILPEAGFELIPVPPSEAFGARQKRNADRMRQKKARKEALLKGVVDTGKSGDAKIDAKDKAPRVIDMEVRNGSGRVHFAKSS
jgi:hypothetical protein